MSNNRSNAKTEVSNFITQVMWFVSSKSANDIMEATRYLITDEPVDLRQCSEEVLMVMGEIYMQRDSRVNAQNLYNIIRKREVRNQDMLNCLKIYAERCKSKYDTVIENWETDENNSIIVRIYLALEAYAKKKNYNKVLEIYERYLRVYQKKKKPRLLSNISDIVSEAYYEKGDYDSCLNYVYKEMDDRHLEAYDNSKMYEMIAKCGYMCNNLEYIMPWKKEPQVKIILAKYYFKHQDYQQAIQTLLTLNQSVSSHVAIQLIGDIYYYQKQFKEALEYYSQSLTVIQKISNPTEEVNAIKNKLFYYIGRCHYQMHDISQMLSAFKEVQFSKLPEGIMYKTIFKLHGDTISLPRYYFKHAAEINQQFSNNQFLLLTIILQSYTQHENSAQLTSVINGVISNHPDIMVEAICSSITNTPFEWPKIQSSPGNKGIIQNAILLSLISGKKHSRYHQKAYDIYTKLINQTMSSKKIDNALCLGAKEFADVFGYAARLSILLGHGSKEEVVGYRAKLAAIYGIDIGSADLEQLQEITQ